MHAGVIRFAAVITTYMFPNPHAQCFVRILYNTVSSTADCAALFAYNVPSHVTFDDGSLW